MTIGKYYWCFFLLKHKTGKCNSLSISVKLIYLVELNTFKPNGISHSYQIDWPIFILRVVAWYFSFFFYSNFNRTSYAETVETLIRDLGPYCFPLSHKKDAKLIWVK